MNKILVLVLISLTLAGCFRIYDLEEELKTVTSIADFKRFKHICVEVDNTQKRLVFTDIQSSCIHINLIKANKLSERWGLGAMKAIWFHELAHLNQIKDFASIYSDVSYKILELKADEYSGCQMKKQGVNPKYIIKYLEKKYLPNSRHGMLKERVLAIKSGFSCCDG